MQIRLRQLALKNRVKNRLESREAQYEFRFGGKGNDGMDRNLARQTEENGKGSRLINWLVLLGGIAIAGITAAVELPGGWFIDKVLLILLRFAATIALFYVLVFRARMADFARRNTSWWEILLSAVFSVHEGARLYRSFRDAYLVNFALGSAPSIPQKLYDAVPLSDGLKTAALTVLLVLLIALSVFAIFLLAVCVIRLLKETFREAFHNPDYPDAVQTLSLKKRILIGAAFAVFTALLCFFTLNKGQEWGADYTVYLTQAIALGTGHPENISVVWGYSALLTPVYLLFGYDRVDFSSILYYKIPAVICLSLLVFVLFLFFSKRFKAGYALVLTAVFGMAPMFVSYTNEILTNIPHLLFSTLAILCLYEMFQSRSLARQIVYAVFAGLTIACSDLIRVNGIVLVLTLACVHVICLLSWILRKNRFFNGICERMPVRNIAVHAIPYVVYFLLIQITNHLVFSGGAGIGARWSGLTAGAETMNSMIRGDGLFRVTLAGFLDSVQYNWSLLTGYLAGLSPLNLFGEEILFFFVPIVAIGIIRSFRKELLCVTYFFGTLAMLCVITYRQGIRYLYPILPMLVLFFAVGIQSFFATAGASFQKPDLARKLLRAGAVLLCATFLIGSSYNAVVNMKNDRAFDLYSFSEDAKDVYHYLMDETDPDSTVIFVKPPVIGLNACRKSTNVLPDKIDGNTYLLITSEGPREHQLTDPEEYGSIQGIEQKEGVSLTLVYSNPRFDLYRVTR